MAVLKEVTFKVTFENLGVPTMGYTSRLFTKNVEQVYIVWSKIGHQKDSRFKVEMIDKNIEKDKG